ncbi:unnamed protein product [Trypanosoma congolense IL3000]|uniref:WGS project CAEQ00000000 data, annotated contig 1881 n=1 Tax=Trypanosoma congolense (strain IL3000) TaxID=1068625 RepID=F9W9M7_TRYCI|nr:unnamed protein product [Trypanosoma congolense IL3000]
MDIDALTRIMTRRVRRRFRYLLSLFVSHSADMSYRAKFTLSHDDAEKLRINNIIAPIHHSQIQGFAWPFCVAELKKAGWRRRMTLWSQEGNLVVRDIHGYTPPLNLYNRIKYLSSVWIGGPALRIDLKASFYQIPISKDASNKLTFWAGSRENGSWYAFKRLPMGHILSPEIMQIAMSTLMGDERFTKHTVTKGDVVIDTWLDDARILSSSARTITRLEQDITRR